MYALRVNLNPHNADVKRKIRDMRKESIADVISRLMELTETKKKSAMAKALGVSPQAVSSWESRDSIPYALCVQVARDKGVSLEWLLSGSDAMAREDRAHYHPAPLSPQEQALLSLFRSLEDDAQREILSAAQEKERMRRLEQRLEELAASVADIKKPA
ncbi:MAG: helix-turn-helix domain-containing protein [Halopseudomonas sp.]|uniref:helix-turn-helix domain-containing protein n=1 Tax=Halopseudomonas sp. TaxID=2901191 RepID=UPI003002945A